MIYLTQSLDATTLVQKHKIVALRKRYCTASGSSSLRHRGAWCVFPLDFFFSFLIIYIPLSRRIKGCAEGTLRSDRWRWKKDWRHVLEEPHSPSYRKNSQTCFSTRTYINQSEIHKRATALRRPKSNIEFCKVLHVLVARKATSERRADSGNVPRREGPLMTGTNAYIRILLSALISRGCCGAIIRAR